MMKKFLEYLRKALVVIVGLVVAILINVPLIACYIWIMSVIILFFLLVGKINDFATKKPLTITDGEEGALGVAVLCAFGGIVFGYNYIENNWNK